MKFPTLTDSRGNESTTLFMAAIVLAAVIIKFIFAEIGPFPAMTAVEFAAGVTAAIGLWRLREYNETK